MSIKRDTVEARKALPIASGVLDYFPDALLAVAEVSRVGNEQHHPGQPLHWDKSKSTDEADALMRHLLDRGTTDSDGLRHTAKVAWRALALLQRELDREAGVVQITAASIDELRAKAMLQQSIMQLEEVGRTYETVDGQRFHGAPSYHTVGIDTGVPESAVTFRGEWPPDTRVGGLLTCCGQSEHPLDCPQWR